MAHFNHQAGPPANVLPQLESHVSELTSCEPTQQPGAMTRDEILGYEEARGSSFVSFADTNVWVANNSKPFACSSGGETIERTLGCCRCSPDSWRTYDGQKYCCLYRTNNTRADPPEIGCSTRYLNSLCNPTCGTAFSSLGITVCGNQLRLRRPVVYVAKKGHNNLALYASAPIPKNFCIIEYAGMVMPQKPFVGTNRYCTDMSAENGAVGTVKFTIDASQMGSAARYANQSCNPTAFMVQLLDSNNVPHVMFVANKDLKPREEITIYYAWVAGDDTGRENTCLCRSMYCCNYLFLPDGVPLPPPVASATYFPEVLSVVPTDSDLETQASSSRSVTQRRVLRSSLSVASAPAAFPPAAHAAFSPIQETPAAASLPALTGFDAVLPPAGSTLMDTSPPTATGTYRLHAPRRSPRRASRPSITVPALRAQGRPKVDSDSDNEGEENKEDNNEEEDSLAVLRRQRPGPAPALRNHLLGSGFTRGLNGLPFEDVYGSTLTNRNAVKCILREGSRIPTEGHYDSDAAAWMNANWNRTDIDAAARGYYFQRLCLPCETKQFRAPPSWMPLGALDCCIHGGITSVPNPRDRGSFLGKSLTWVAAIRYVKSISNPTLYTVKKSKHLYPFCGRLRCIEPSHWRIDTASSESHSTANLRIKCPGSLACIGNHGRRCINASVQAQGPQIYAQCTSHTPPCPWITYATCPLCTATTAQAPAPSANPNNKPQAPPRGKSGSRK